MFACTQRAVSGASRSGVRLDICDDLTSSSVVILVLQRTGFPYKGLVRIDILNR